jgi:hypothetical protein
MKDKLIKKEGIDREIKVNKTKEKKNKRKTKIAFTIGITFF